MPYFEIGLIFVLIILNGLLAMAELAIASSRMVRLRTLADRGVRGARRAMALASDPGRFLSTVQIGITLIGITAGAFSGATLGARVSDWLLTWGMSEQVAEMIGFGSVIGIITYLSLIIGELVPKQVALRDPEKVACLVAPAMTLLAKFAGPLVTLLDLSGRIILKLLGQDRMSDQRVTDAEIHTLVAEAESAGVLEPEERTMISGVMRLGDRTVRSVMTARGEVEMVNVDDPTTKIGKQIADSQHSRFVAYSASPENIIGVLQARDVASALLRRRSPNMKSLVKEAVVVPDMMDALEVVDRLKKSAVHFGFVYDEYGHFEGIVTTMDILEAIVGVFKHDASETEPDIVERDDGSLLVSGGTPIDVVMQRLNMPTPNQRDYQTVGGFVLDRLGRLPSVGEWFNEGIYRFEVLDLDERRIDKVLVSRRGPTVRRARN